MKIAFVTSEIMPYSKTGGLADVSLGLTQALRKFEDVVCITPLYRSIDKSQFEFTGKEFDLFGDKFAVYKKDYVYFIEANFFDRMYGYPDDEERFIKFCFVALRLIEDLGNFDVVHVNDWQTALLAFLLKRAGFNGQVVLTIHNLAYQGIADKHLVEQFGLGWENFTFDKLEFYDRINLLKAGIVFADKFNTVSPSYAKEILTPTFAEGLGDVIYEHSYKLKGILNGIDYDEFNPETDRRIVVNYSKEKVTRKQKNKEILLRYAGLKDANKPLFSFVGRFTRQKGLNLLVDNARFVTESGANLIILGSGELDWLVRPLSNLEGVAVFEGYNESLARMIYAASDFLLMPSLFEPCGLSQMIAAAYGAIPIVSRVGGLIDTVSEDNPDKIFGFTFFAGHYEQFQNSIRKAIELYKNKDEFYEKARYNMAIRFSWEKTAKEYLEFYRTRFTKPARKEEYKEEHEPVVPASYNENRVCVMNVNPELCYVYWNVEQKLIDAFDSLNVVVFDEGKIIFSYKIDGTFGEYFLHYHNPLMKTLRARIGYFESGSFVDVLDKLKLKAIFGRKALVVKHYLSRVVYYG